MRTFVLGLIFIIQLTFLYNSCSAVGKLSSQGTYQYTFPSSVDTVSGLQVQNNYLIASGDGYLNDANTTLFIFDLTISSKFEPISTLTLPAMCDSSLFAYGENSLLLYCGKPYADAPETTFYAINVDSSGNLNITNTTSITKPSYIQPPSQQGNSSTFWVMAQPTQISPLNVYTIDPNNGFELELVHADLQTSSVTFVPFLMDASPTGDYLILGVYTSNPSVMNITKMSTSTWKQIENIGDSQLVNNFYISAYGSVLVNSTNKFELAVHNANYDTWVFGPGLVLSPTGNEYSGSVLTSQLIYYLSAESGLYQVDMSNPNVTPVLLSSVVPQYPNVGYAPIAATENFVYITAEPVRDEVLIAYPLVN